MYLTGGLGSKGETEAFGDDYVLPNLKAYTETCASIGGMLWYHRMFLRSGDVEVPRRASSARSTTATCPASRRPATRSSTRTRWRPTARPQRSAYFEVACCPANLARLMAQLPSLAYAQRAGEVFVSLYVGSQADLKVGPTPVRLSQQTKYPWEGRVAITVAPERPVEFTLSLRVPGWAQGEAVPTDLYRYADAAALRRSSLTVNGVPSVP